jgi:type II secretory pathway pseudopilin PulG
MKEQKGITLVALVITIIILLILAAISIATLTGQNGLFNRAKQAKNNTLDSQVAENAALNSYEVGINEALNGLE